MSGRRQRVVVQQPPPEMMQQPMERVDGSMNHNRIFIYPCYIDNEMTEFQGRKLPKEQCVQNPFIEEISRAIFELGFEGIYSMQKRHPRNFWKFGRAAITFYKKDEATGNRVPIYPQYPKRKDVYRAIAKKIVEIRANLSNKDRQMLLQRLAMKRY
ncbi:SRP19 protein [Trichomonas vaginalis G3]|uniref:SRP19 protein n=1 Tax=Trichomonas vaginalis (strain ATCC PRA-98 / G3) TaxID=412133 RepID=A2FBB0_TRIV3|nr:signal recognition particle 19 kDa protein (Srp19) family [Trichomonas vaginalis G3]EAX97790.1 SRP19 protein [Trichomonas vaginalis G3]KAI5552734.1 signal recognition particle 19 kDa protein (Srp19) family [Trichomonas vaginalis G3]|eukprot:XP_001310720.1 SRP19 protein [Trichomonas vaginalis G3]